MKRNVCAALAVCVLAIPTARGEDLTDPVAIFKKTDAAAKAVKSVKYHAQSETKGGFAPVIQGLAGDLVLIGEAGKDMPSKFRADVKFKSVGADQPQRMRIAYDGSSFTVLDDSEKKAYRGANAMPRGSTAFAVFQSLLMVEYTHPTPFSDEINAKKAELKGTVKVGDEECYHLQVLYMSQPVEAAWYISKKDFLPRRVDRFSQSDLKAWRTLTVTNLVVDPKTDDATFKLATPDGYTDAEGAAP